MGNTNFPESIAPGSAGLIAFGERSGRELNELTRHTGVRNIAALLTNSWKLGSGGGEIHLWRERDMVSLATRRLDGSEATNAAFLTHAAIGPGFRPATPGESPLFRAESGGSPSGFARAWWDSTNIISSVGTVWGTYSRLLQWRTADAFPSLNALPGTAVTPPPA